MNKTYTIYDTRLKIIGLLEGSEYLFRVTATNAAGDSQPSDASPYVLCKDPTCKTFHCLITDNFQLDNLQQFLTDINSIYLME